MSRESGRLRAFLASQRTRRQILAGAAGVSAAGALEARGAARESTPAASPAAAGAWTFTDDAGVTVTLPVPPERIVADLNAARALWDFGIRPVAVSGYTVTTDAAWGNVDRSIPAINAGPETGAPDPERRLALQPDLFVTITWSPDDPARLRMELPGDARHHGYLQTHSLRRPWAHIQAAAFEFATGLNTFWSP